MTKRKILSGGNRQIPKGYGDAPVQAYLDAVTAAGPGGWKHAACRRIDAIVSEQVPGVCKAVKWNSPFYGMERDCWFLSFHCFDKYVKVTFFRGAELDPPPEETSKYPSATTTCVKAASWARRSPAGSARRASARARRCEQWAGRA